MELGHFLFGQFCVISVFFVVRSNGLLDVGLISAYFTEKNTNRASVIGCFKKQEKKSFTKKLILGRQPISVLNLEEVSKIDFLKTNDNRMGVILDGDCNLEKIRRFLTRCGTEKYFDVKHHWLVITSNNSFSAIFENVEIYINADIQMARVSPSKNVTVEDLYNPAYGKGGLLKTKIIGYYNEKDGYRAREMQCRYWLRRNMTGVKLKSNIVLPVPFDGSLLDYLNSEANPEINTFNRFHYSVLCPCVNYYNFTPNVTLKKSWGYLTENGSWDGLVAALDEKVVDYGSSPLFVRTDRATVMEYGRRTWTLRAAFVFQNPKTSTTADVFFKPLSLSTWITTALAMAFVIWFFRTSQLFEKETFDKHADTSWSYFVICTFAAFCQQGMTTTPSSYSGRIIILSLLILSLMIYQFYSASLVSTLLMRPETKIKNVEDILTSEMKVGCEDTLYNRDYFKYTIDKTSRDLYVKKILEKRNASNFLTPREGLALVKNGGYAFHVELATAYPIIQKTFSDQSVCRMREIQMYRTQPMHANVQKHSPFRDMFDTCLQRLAEHGIIHREATFWHPKKPECIQSGTVSLHIGLDYFYPCLIFLAVGMIVSLLVLTLEVYIDFKQKNLQRKQHPVYPFLH